MHIREGVGSVAKVTTELRYLFNSSWDWQVRKIANGMYEFVAPSKADLDLLIKFTEFQCRSSDLKVCVERSSLATDSFASLSSVWVRASGFPQWARKEKVVEEVAFLIGDPEEIDKQSLIGRGTIRVKVQCKHLGEISGSSEVFLNGFGYKITWTVETTPGTSQQTATLQDPGNQGKDDEDKEEEKSDSYTPFQEEFAKEGQDQQGGDGNGQASQTGPGTKRVGHNTQVYGSSGDDVRPVVF